MSKNKILFSNPELEIYHYWGSLIHYIANINKY